MILKRSERDCWAGTTNGIAKLLLNRPFRFGEQLEVSGFGHRRLTMTRNAAVVRRRTQAQHKSWRFSVDQIKRRLIKAGLSRDALRRE